MVPSSFSREGEKTDQGHTACRDRYVCVGGGGVGADIIFRGR